MSRIAVAFAVLAVFGVIKLPSERAFSVQHGEWTSREANEIDQPGRLDVGDIANPNLREGIGQLGLVAALSGFRAVVADFLFIRAHVAWERAEWSRVSLLFREVTTLQPRVTLFWDMAAWHMAWNASAAAMNDPSQPRLALRVKAQREYFALGKGFLERGIRNNPNKPQLYEALAQLYRDKLDDHERASEFYWKAATLPGAHSYDRRFSAYELSYCESREREAYDRLRALYDEGERERLPTLVKRLKFLESKLNIPADQRVPEMVK